MMQKEQLTKIRQLLQNAYDRHDMTTVTRLSLLLDQYAAQQAREQLGALSKPA